MTWFAFLLQAVGPLAIRVLTTLGMSVVTFTGVTQAVDTMIGLAVSNWSALPAAVMGLASLAGVPEALGMVLGAMVARATLWAATSATRLMFKA